MKRIYKYVVPNCPGLFTIYMPRKFAILHVGIQPDNICLWAMVDPYENNVPRQIRVVATGEYIYDDYTGYNYIGTVQDPGGFVWHVLEEKTTDG